MTEINDNTDPLPAAVTRFVLHWGDLGSQWGVNRSVAQIHALLYLSERPLHAEEVADTLGLARSNVSNSIKELLGWGLIHRVPMLGDRRDHFAAETDIWEIVTRIAKGRKAREVDPAEAALLEALGGPPAGVLRGRRHRQAVGAAWRGSGAGLQAVRRSPPAAAGSGRRGRRQGRGGRGRRRQVLDPPLRAQERLSASHPF